MKKRIISLFCALLLLTPGFLLRTRSGRIQYYDYAAGLWHETSPPWTVSPQSTGRCSPAAFRLKTPQRSPARWRIFAPDFVIA